MKTRDFFYHLPEELIAQHPLDRRDTSRMMVLDRKNTCITHKTFEAFPEMIPDDTMVVINNTKVFPARLILEKQETGARVEVFLLRKTDESRNIWKCLVKPSKKVKTGTLLLFPSGDSVEIIEKQDEGLHYLRFNCENDFPLIYKFGRTPLPPYIKRDEEDAEDKDRYQTVFADKVGAVAAPTAGFHFTENTLSDLVKRNIPVHSVTLYVGLGTFRPVTAENVEEHVMDSERYEIPFETAEAINDWKKKGGRILAVGTTSVRTLEGCYRKYGSVRAIQDETDIFIYPPAKPQVVDYLLTNFHLPESTLIMLVSSFAGREYVLNAYEEAVNMKYRFYSYGDCMLVL